jgi:hypothetical protein
VANPERTFLHDISSPLTTLELNLGNVISILEERNPSDIDECLKLAKSCLTQLQRAGEMIHARRAVLIQESEDKK